MLIDTLEAGRHGYGECGTDKARSGGSARALPRYPETSPRELKTQEGIELWAGLNPLSVATDRCPEQGPGGDVGGCGSGELPRREQKLINDKRARFADEAGRLGSGKNP